MMSERGPGRIPLPAEPVLHPGTDRFGSSIHCGGNRIGRIVAECREDRFSGLLCRDVGVSLAERFGKAPLSAGFGQRNPASREILLRVLALVYKE